MKKIIAATTSFFIVVFSFAAGFSVKFSPAEAGGEFLRVITRDTPFFSDEAMTDLLFYIPYTYYVKFISQNGEVAHIEYGDFAPAIDGYTRYSLLFSDGLEVVNPYVSLTVRTRKTTAFYADNRLTDCTRYVFAERNLIYYGFVEFEDSFAYYVSYGGNLGYVKEESLYPFTVSDHPNEQTFLKKDEPVPAFSESEKESEKDGTFVLRIVIIGLLIFAGLIAAFTVKRTKKQDSASYYDENDFG